MAKVEISFPDDFLRRVERAADQAGETRDEFLRRAAERELEEDKARRHKQFEEMMPPPIHGGGGSAEWIRWDRDHRDDKRLGPDGGDD
ncbi:MAG TPA: hypothetical protein VH299_02625 [Solirubrobacterales bacterium]|nr:hypothetical protein [Solirubrobacterales bacterium]